MTSSSPYGPTSERISVDNYPKHEGEYLVYLFHLATYDFVVSAVADRRVLDYGCGTGYGTHRLAAHSKSIVGVDVSRDAINFANTRYSADNLAFLHISPVEDSALPFADKSFDVVLSFQVIEHVPNPTRYLAEVCRLLTHDGILVLATPDRTTRLLPRQRPWNRYHRLEYDAAQLERLVKSHFSEVEMNLMSGEPTVIERELRRCRRLKWMTLPFTLPFGPEAWRQAGLSGIKRIQSRTRKRSDLRMDPRTDGMVAMEGAGKEPDATYSYPYDQSALWIAPEASPSVNLVVVARSPRETAAATMAKAPIRRAV